MLDYNSIAELIQAAKKENITIYILGIFLMRIKLFLRISIRQLFHLAIIIYQIQKKIEIIH